MNGIITLDIGTSSIRSTLYDEAGTAFPADQRLNPPIYYSDGRVEQDPGGWRDLLPLVLSSAAKCAAQAGVVVAAISVTGQRSSILPVDGAGCPLRPAIIWHDRRTAPLVSELSKYNAMVHAKTGLKISTVFSAIKILWIRRNEPEVFARTHKMLGIQDYVLFLLTGLFATDQSLASRTNLLDLKSRSWDAGLADLFDVDMDMLCELLRPGSVVGGLGREIAGATGLAAGTPVVTAGGDQQCAALGLGLFSPDKAVSNTGTGSYILGHSTRPATDSGMRLSCNVAALPGAYIIEASLPTSGSIYRWFQENLWCGSKTETESYEAMSSEAGESGRGAHGVLLLPHFNGSGTPACDTEATGLFAGLTLATKRGDLARAILEGIALDLKGGLELVEEVAGPITSVQVSGGMSKSPLFNQIQADAFGVPVLRYSESEATSFGAWIAGTVATGLAPDYPLAFERAAAGARSELFKPQREATAFYQRLRKKAQAIDSVMASPEVRNS
jgi:glycerol kinase